MKTKSTIALITTLLLTSIGAYAQPNRMNNGEQTRWQSGFDHTRTTRTTQNTSDAHSNQNTGNWRGSWQNTNRYPQTNNHAQDNQQNQWQKNNNRYPQPQIGYERNTHNPYNQHSERYDNRWQNSEQYTTSQRRMTYRQGDRLPVAYRGWRGARYEVQDWRNHRNLYAPPSGARWMVSVDGDFILASILTGVIYSVIHS